MPFFCLLFQAVSTSMDLFSVLFLLVFIYFEVSYLHTDLYFFLAYWIRYHYKVLIFFSSNFFVLKSALITVYQSMSLHKMAFFITFILYNLSGSKWHIFLNNLPFKFRSYIKLPEHMLLYFLSYCFFIWSFLFLFNLLSVLNCFLLLIKLVIIQSYYSL